MITANVVRTIQRQAKLNKHAIHQLRPLAPSAAMTASRGSCSHRPIRLARLCHAHKSASILKQEAPHIRTHGNDHGGGFRCQKSLRIEVLLIDLLQVVRDV